MKKKKKLSHIITVRLFIAVFIAFLISSAVTYAVLCKYCADQAYELLLFNTSGLTSDFASETMQLMMESSTKQIAILYYDEGEEAAAEDLAGSNYTYFVRKDGTIFLSGNQDFIGKNVKDIEMIGNILDTMVKSLEADPENMGMIYQATPYPVKTIDGKMDVYYLVVGSNEAPDAILVAAYTIADYEGNGLFAANTITYNRRIGRTGYYVLIPPDKKMVATDPNLYDKPFPYTELINRYEGGTDSGIKTYKTARFMPDGTLEEYDQKLLYGKEELWGEKCYYCLFKQYGVYMLSIYPATEAMEHANDTIVFIILVEIVVFTVLFIVLHLLIKRRVVRKLDAVNTSLTAITDGNLEQRVEVRDSREFDELSTDINSTVDKLKEYIAEAAARIDADLAVGKAIQSSALPYIFPPFPEKKEFELFASMNTAKEVGGDFYDFYMLNDNTLGFLIADVSGKSIPGAMFMMTSKTIIKSLAESGMSPAEVFDAANEKLCEGNEAEMFVTAWLGYLDLHTGLVRVANAGHNPPVLIRDGNAEYVDIRPGLVLAGMDGIQYKEHSLQLQKGDILYLYTDGVTEAMNKDEELYGEDRLQKLLSFGENYPAPSAENGISQSVCDKVLADVNKYVNGAEQSDDITMLCIRYLGGE